jgi:hypothetical protein
MRLFKLLLITQSIYILLTAIWPLIHIQSFVMVTGPKHDLWLVKTVGALLIPVGVCLLSYLLVTSNKVPAVLLGSLTTVAFIIIDFYYSVNDVISDVYQIDGIIQFVFLTGWLIYIGRMIRLPHTNVSNSERQNKHGHRLQ